MISVEKLHNYLNKSSGDDSVELKTYTFKIPETKMSDGHIYGKYIMDAKYVFLGKELLPVPSWTGLDDNYQLLIDKSVSKRNTFVISILNQVMPEFRYFDVKSRVNFARDLMRQIAYDMQEKSLYSEMEYTRVRNDIRENFINFEDIDNIELMKKIIVDYFSLTVYILHENKESKFGSKRLVEKISFIPGVWKKSDRAHEYSIKNPSCFLVEVDGKYNSIIREELNGIFSWQDDGMEDLFIKLSDESNLFEKTKKKYNTKKSEVSGNVSKIKEKIQEKIEEKIEEKSEGDLVIPKKITLLEIQKLAEKHGISLVKKSEKTGKELKKTIQELRDELLNSHV